MNPLLALLVIIMAFGVVGRIDYEVRSDVIAISNRLYAKERRCALINLQNSDGAISPRGRRLPIRPHDPRATIDDDDDPTLDVISDVRGFLSIGRSGMSTMDRTRFIGGGDVAAILGVSPWKSPFRLYQEKTGAYVEEITLAKQRIFDRGHRWEPVVVEMLDRRTSGPRHDVQIIARNARYLDR